jgi:magnesium transporter
MEVLSEVDGERIAALRGRDEFFWLDLESPSEADLDAVGELLALHELALEDTREFD